MAYREELLLRMYDQLFNDINRHIMVVWQSVGVLVGAFAIFALVEKNIISNDIASSIIMLLCSWLIAHLFDAAYWYNRNLVMIANIERQFLVKADLKEIHYYFGAHRPNNKMIEHLRLQLALGVGLGFIVLAYHFYERVVPGFNSSLENFDPVRATPYVVVIFSCVYLYKLKGKLKAKYQEFIINSPGKVVDASEVSFGVGHGHEPKV
ncbi:hypothetical protein GCM10009098_24980 [Rheinheimera aquimaris]|uniref:Uncharacterized protein n=1 Tax=Rheinheimera aquimaris TaxID=412437 RepID=A0ABP3P0M0_9GAMM|nr:hypothetical protein [Rheinheimera aquimaris]MCB5214898.1 hypothetical protein [Rheinheimera aquimaris]